MQSLLHLPFLSPPEQDALPLHKGCHLPAPLASLEKKYCTMLIMKVLILPSRCAPFIHVPFSSQPDKLNLPQPDSPADFTACFVYSTSCFYWQWQAWMNSMEPFIQPEHSNWCNNHHFSTICEVLWGSMRGDGDVRHSRGWSFQNKCVNCNIPELSDKLLCPCKTSVVSLVN